MTQEPQKNKSVLIVIAVIGVVGTIFGAIINVVGNYNVEKLRQETELTRIALVSIATQGGATQMVLQSTVNAPTQSPAPTYTPYPTTSSPTAEVRVVTATLMPTLTPTQTQYPLPTALLEPNTTWENNGLALTLSDFKYIARNGKCVAIHFELKNRSNHDIIIGGKRENFEAIDNLGQKWKLTELGWSDFYDCEGNINEDWLTTTINAGEALYHGCGGSCYGFDVVFSGDITDTKIEFINIVISNFSQITYVAWKIPIYH
jgi:hypothetical protein